MIRKGVGLCLMAVVICASGWLLGQEPAKGKKALPTYWSKIGLSDEQKQKVYAIQADYGAKIDVLQQQVKTLQKQERTDLEKVLTDSQKVRLRELAASKAGLDTPAKDEKKPEEKKKE